MNSNQKNLSVLTVIISLLVGILSGIGTATVVYFGYQSPQLALYQKQLDMYQKQLDIMNETLSTQNESLSVQNEQIGIMNESLVKRVQLELEVVPRYSWEVDVASNGSMRLVNTTLGIPRDKPTIFNIYVANVGDSIAHLLYWTVTIFAPPNSVIREGPMNDIQNIVLTPYSTYNMTYTYDPSTMGGAENSEIFFVFALMSTESIIYETVNAILG